MARQETFSPFQSFLAGRQARQAEDYASTRNKLAEIELADAPAQMQRRNALADVQVQTAQTGLEGAQQQLGAEKAKFAYAKLKQALDSGNPKAFITSQIPDLAAKLQQQGIDLASMDDQSVAQLTDQLAHKYAGDAGIAPAQPASFTLKPGEARYAGERIVAERGAGKPDSGGFTLSPGETRYGPDGKLIASAPQKSTAGAYRALTPTEIQQAGLPPGTSAQIGPDGKIDVLSKRDNTGSLSQKDLVTAKQKMNAVKIARQQLQRIKDAYSVGVSSNGGPTNAFGGAQGWIPTQQGKSFDAAVDQMRSTLTALTRVPGVGSMSDYESKLDQAKFPSRTDYESVTAEKIQGIDDLLNAIETGYSDMLSGNATSSNDERPAVSSEPQGEMHVRSIQEAMKLPPGTVFITPDGRRKVR